MRLYKTNIRKTKNAFTFFFVLGYCITEIIRCSGCCKINLTCRPNSIYKIKSINANYILTTL